MLKWTVALTVVLFAIAAMAQPVSDPAKQTPIKPGYQKHMPNAKLSTWDPKAPARQLTDAEKAKMKPIYDDYRNQALATGKLR